MGSDYKEDVARKYVIAYKSGDPLTHSRKMFLFLKWFVDLRKVILVRSGKVSPYSRPHGPRGGGGGWSITLS
jgi:hypothetical protein